MTLTSLIAQAYPVVARIASAGGLFGIFIITTYVFSAQDAAIVFKFQVWTNIASAITQFGLSIVALRLANQLKRPAKRLFYRGLSILTIPFFTWPFAALAGLLASGYLGDPEATPELKLLYLIMILGHCFCQILADLYRALGRNKLSAVIVLTPTLSTLSLSTANLNNLTTTQLIYYLAFSHLVVAIGGLVSYALIYRHFFPRMSFALQVRYVRSTLRRGFSALSTSMLAMLSAQVDQAIMSRLAPPDVFARYSTAVRFAQALNVLINSVNPIATTHALKLFSANGRAHLITFLRQYTRALSMATILGITTLALIHPYLLPTLEHNVNTFSFYPTIFIMIPAAFNLATGPKGYLLWVFGYEKETKAILIISTTLVTGAALSYYFTADLTTTAALIGISLLMQYVAEIFLIKHLLRIDYK